jgi:hypothetical protein
MGSWQRGKYGKVVARLGRYCVGGSGGYGVLPVAVAFCSWGFRRWGCDVSFLWRLAKHALPCAGREGTVWCNSMVQKCQEITSLFFFLSFLVSSCLHFTFVDLIWSNTRGNSRFLRHTVHGPQGFFSRARIIEQKISDLSDEGTAQESSRS